MKTLADLNLGMRYSGHDRGIVLTQPEPGKWHERPMTRAELAAREAAARIQDDIYRHASSAGACYHELWEIIAAAAQTAIDAERASTISTRGDAMSELKSIAAMVLVLCSVFWLASACTDWGQNEGVKCRIGYDPVTHLCINSGVTR